MIYYLLKLLFILSKTQLRVQNTGNASKYKLEIIILSIQKDQTGFIKISSFSSTPSNSIPTKNKIIKNKKMLPRKPKSKSETIISKMLKSLFFKPVLLLLSIFLLFLYLSSTKIPNSPSIPKRPKIFMYDLPRKFTYGVIESYARARGSSENVKYPGHQHGAEWFLFDDLKRNGRSGLHLERVDDPDEADFFYVPFFSSLSLNVNSVSREVGKEVEYSDEKMQEELIEWLEGSKYWKRNNGRDHVFIAQDPNALYKVIDKVSKGVLLISDFGRLRRDQASLVKDVILPYSHRINPYKGDVGVGNRETLLFFMGNRYRKEGGKIRDILFQILEHEKDVVIKHGTQSRVSRRMATQGMHSSKFCLHPAGDTPSACRLFDAIVSLCVPVIISDYIELPFEDAIDYKKIAVFVDTDSAVKPGYLSKLLKRISEDEILQYQKEIKLVKRYFEYDDPNGTVNETWRQVSSKLPLIKLMINRDKRLTGRSLDDPDCSCICSRQNNTAIV